MKRMAKIVMTMLTSAATLAACGPPPYASIPDDAPTKNKEFQSLEERVRVLEESMPLLACGPELRALFRDIRRECNAGTALESEGASEGKTADQPESSTCKVEQLKGAIASAERDLETRSIGQKLISLLRHEVVYLSDRDTISSWREKRLRLLAAERRLPSTRFLIVSAPIPSSADGERRAAVVRNRLSALGIPNRESVADGDAVRHVVRFDNPWIYRILVPPNMLKPADRPVPPEPRDFERAVYIFRSECL